MDAITQQLFEALEGNHTALAKNLIDDMTPEQLGQTDEYGATPLFLAHTNSFNSKEDYRNLLTIVYKMRPEDLTIIPEYAEISMAQHAAGKDDLVLNSVIAELLPAKHRAPKGKIGKSMYAHAALGDQYELAELYLDKMPDSQLASEASLMLICLSSPQAGYPSNRALTDLFAPKMKEIEKAAKEKNIDALVDLHIQARDQITEEYLKKISESPEILENMRRARNALADKVLSRIPEQEIPGVLASDIGGLSLAGMMFQSGLTKELKKHISSLPLSKITGESSLFEAVVDSISEPGAIAIAELLLDRIPKGDERLNSDDIQGQPLLYNLCQMPLPEDAAERARIIAFTQEFIEKSQQASLTRGDERGFTPLHCALRYAFHACKDASKPGEGVDKANIPNLPIIVSLVKRMDHTQLRELRHAFNMLDRTPQFVVALLSALKPELSSTDLLKLPKEIFTATDKASGRMPPSFN